MFWTFFISIWTYVNCQIHAVRSRMNAKQSSLEELVLGDNLDWSTGPLNLLAASTGTLLSHFYKEGNVSGAAALGEIRGEIVRL